MEESSLPEMKVGGDTGNKIKAELHERSLDADAMEDFRKSAGQIQNFKERLVNIGEAGKNGHMNSYGSNKEATLKQIVSMRKAQVEIFRKHMGLELSLSEKVDTEAEINSKEFSEQFQVEFHEKENELKSITTMLDSLSKVMRSVNDDTRSELLPTEPGVQPSDSKHSLKSVQRSRNININSDKQAPWRNKLHLNPSAQAPET